jgi:hypothetical protein
MVALVNDECIFGNGGGVDVIGVEEVDEFRGDFRGSSGRCEADI